MKHRKRKQKMTFHPIRWCEDWCLCRFIKTQRMNLTWIILITYIVWIQVILDTWAPVFISCSSQQEEIPKKCPRLPKINLHMTKTGLYINGKGTILFSIFKMKIILEYLITTEIVFIGTIGNVWQVVLC